MGIAQSDLNRGRTFSVRDGRCHPNHSKAVPLPGRSVAMLFMPFHVLGIWLRGLLSLLLIGAGLFLLNDWNNHRSVVVEEPGPAVRRAPEVDRPAPPIEEQKDDRVRVVTWRFGLNRATA